MRKPAIGEFNLGALAGVVTGSIGGLFAIGVVRAILGQDIHELFSMPILSLISFMVCGAAGWLAGGQVGPRLGDRYHSMHAEYGGGALGGLVPVVLVGLWAWYMTTH